MSAPSRGSCSPPAAAPGCGALTATCPKPLLEVAGRPLIRPHPRRAGAGRADRAHGGHRLPGPTCWSRRWATAGRTACGCGVRPAAAHRRHGPGRSALARPRAGRARPSLFGWGDILVDPACYLRVVAAATTRAPRAGGQREWNDDPYAGAAVTLDGQARVQRLVEKPPRGTSGDALEQRRLRRAGPRDLAPRRCAAAPRPGAEYRAARQRGRGAARRRAASCRPYRWRDPGSTLGNAREPRGGPGLVRQELPLPTKLEVQ